MRGWLRKLEEHCRRSRREAAGDPAVAKAMRDMTAERQIAEAAMRRIAETTGTAVDLAQAAALRQEARVLLGLTQQHLRHFHRAEQSRRERARRDFLAMDSFWAPRDERR
jgi:hypothetical protein